MITLQQLRNVVGRQEFPEVWERNVSYAADTFPVGVIPFLTSDYLVKIRKQIMLSEDHARMVADTMDWIRESDDRIGLFWLWHCILFRRPDFRGEKVSIWPVPTDAAAANGGNRSNVFPVVVLLSGYPQLLEIYERRNIPESAIVDTLSAVDSCMKLYKERTGQNGFGTFYLHWLLHHFHGEIYKLGRLEYEITTLGPHVRVYEHVHNGSRIAFSEPGIAYREDGLVDGTNGRFDGPRSWVASFSQTAQHLEGHPVTWEGCVEREAVSIPKIEWRLVLEPDDAVLSVHIPREGKLTHELCGESLSLAAAFFAAHYPEKRFHAFTCSSWLMDPQLQFLLDDSSNLVQFQRRFSLFPVLGTDEGLYRFVFHCDPCEIRLLPENTLLQRNLKRYMAAGGSMRSAGGYILQRIEE
ncbi:acyltransferase domain-containing protein [Paenibacillus koleovorans]|uniref:acyltransferase domain-containing protein n=1 Tax=Paenibacillus koleovorans TaxID=121608 RepID=UPI000FDAFCBF|nr:acyltransferase domain-containing protein [Paenibacillus koleovorans]